MCGAFAKDEAALSLAETRAALISLVAQPRFGHAQWGIKVVAVESGREVFSHNAQSLLKPASNAKLFTAGFALDRLGPDFRIRTSLYRTGELRPDGTLAGDLVLYGRGDPSLSSRWSAGGDPMAALAKSAAAAGLRKVSGAIVADATWLTGPPYGGSWTWEDLLSDFGSPASALVYEDNFAELRVLPTLEPNTPPQLEFRPGIPFFEISNEANTAFAGSERTLRLDRPLAQNRLRLSGRIAIGSRPWSTPIPVHDAPLWFATAFGSALRQQGGDFTRIATRAWPDTTSDVASWNELTFRHSPPVAELVARMMKESDNLQAQLLFLQAGARIAGQNALTNASEALAQRAFAAFLREMRAAPGTVLLEEGSGLSRSSLVTPDAIVTLLRYADRAPWKRSFRVSLPVSGRDGSLTSRLGEPAAKDRVIAKTGALRYVSALSGYLRPRSGEELAFSLILNAYSGSTSARDEVDDAARTLLRLNERLAASE